MTDIGTAYVHHVADASVLLADVRAYRQDARSVDGFIMSLAELFTAIAATPQREERRASPALLRARTPITPRVLAPAADPRLPGGRSPLEQRYGRGVSTREELPLGHLIWGETTKNRVKVPVPIVGMQLYVTDYNIYFGPFTVISTDGAVLPKSATVQGPNGQEYPIKLIGFKAENPWPGRGIHKEYAWFLDFTGDAKKEEGKDWLITLRVFGQLLYDADGKYNTEQLGTRGVQLTANQIMHM